MQKRQLDSLMKKVLESTPEEEARWKNAMDRFEAEENRKRAELAPFHKMVSHCNLTRHDFDTKKLEDMKDTHILGKAFETVQNWDPSKQYGYFLYGDVGRGKTHLLKGLIIKWALRGVNGEFWTLTDLMAYYRSDFDSMRSMKIKLMEQKVLVIDDFGAENTSDFVKQEMLSLIDMRLNRGMGLFLSSNFHPGELAEIYGTRIVDRLASMMVSIEIKSPTSYRAHQGMWNKEDAGI